METKKCSTCKQTLALNDFSKDSRYKQGVKGQCKSCLMKMQNKRRKKNPDKYRKKMNDWIKSNPLLTEKRRIRAYTKYLTDRGFSVFI